MESSTQTESAILVEAEVAAVAKCKITQLRSWVKTGRFPAPRQIGAHKFWIKADVLDFLYGVGTRTKNSRKA